MKNVIYPFIGAALVTIAPFLLTFETGQDIVHGIFSFSALLLLLVIAWVKHRFNRVKKIVLIFVVLLLLVSTVVDLCNILALQSKPLGLNILIPVGACSLAVIIVSRVKKMTLPMMNTIVFVTLGLHFFLLNVSLVQPLLEFPVTRALERSSQIEPRNKLSNSFKQMFKWSESPMISMNYTDTSRTTVVVLVESWGIPIDTCVFKKELDVFKALKTDYGVHHRMYSMTRTAEREDLVYSISNSEEKKDSTFIPQIYKEKNRQSTFLVGVDSLLYRRNKYIHNMGFTNVIFADSVPDSLLVKQIDSLLQDSSKIQFIAWTTRDTRFPIQGDSKKLESTYYSRMFKSLNMIKELALRHPSARFVVQGDHEPLLCPKTFAEQFYRRWVPYIVLN